jgi:ribonuclease VapC
LIALDTSAIIPIALSEPEREEFCRIIVRSGALVGAPTLVEALLVLFENRRLERLYEWRSVSFSIEMYHLAATAFCAIRKGPGTSGSSEFRQLPVLCSGQAQRRASALQGRRFLGD